MTKYNRFLFIAFLIVLGKLSGLLKDILITFYHGVSNVTDAYFLSNSISSLLYMAVYSAVPVLVVPLYASLAAEKSTSRTDTEMSAALVFLLVISACIALLVVRAAPSLVGVFSGDVDSDVKSLAISYLSIMALTFSFSTLVSFYNSIQTVNSVVLPSYIVPIFNNSIFCVGLLIFSSPANFTSILFLGLMSWIVLSVVNFTIIRSEIVFRPSAALDLALNRRFVMLFLPAALSFYIEQMNGFVGVYFASKLGLGAISIYSYSNKINMMVLSVFLVFLTASMFPRMAAVSAVGERGEMNGYLVRCLRVIVMLSVPIVGFLHLYSNEIVELLFRRGNFTADDVEKVAMVLSVIVFALPFSLVRDTMNRVIFARGSTVVPLLLALLSLTVNIFIAYVTFRSFGLLGLAFAVVISTIVACVVVTSLVGRIIETNLLMVWMRMGFLSVSCAGAAYFLIYWMSTVTTVHWALFIFPYVMVYVLFLNILRVPETQMALRIVRGRLRRL